MCGILGVSTFIKTVDSKAFEIGLDTLIHRGPDDRGVYSDGLVMLGHRRLSIIDLSDSGHQPMIDEVTGAVLVFNGEIYNYLELREELEEKGILFFSNTDSEVLLKAFLEWGEDCLNKLNGMWAFAIWQPEKKSLFFARDRFGVKPFYYCRPDEKGFAFASEPKALLSIFPSFKKVNEQSLFNFLAEGMLYTSGHSFYEGIDILLPACCGEFFPEKGVLNIRKYWDYPVQTVHRSNEELSAEFNALLDDAIKIRLRSDVDVGITLSGGLDSTAILAGAMNNLNSKQLGCFTSVYGEGNKGELEWVNKAVLPYDLSPIEVKATKDSWIETLTQISWYMDAPGYSPAIYPLWFLMQNAREKKIPVLLEGQGADEALGGYPQYGAIMLLEAIKKAIASPCKANLDKLICMWRGLAKTFSKKWVLLWLVRESFPWMISMNRKRVGAYSVLDKKFIDAYGAESKNIYTDSLETNPSMDSLGRRLMYDHSKGILPGLLHYGDAISMSQSIESRLPFLDYRIVEFLFSTPSTLKIYRGQTKWVLREFLAKLGQKTIAKRPDKKGYPTPVEQWLAEENGKIAREILLNSNALIHKYCDPVKLEQLIDRHCAGKSGSGNHLYRLVSTELWLQTCIGS